MPKTRNIQTADGGTKNSYRYTVFFEPIPKGGYNVFVPAIPEICTFGDTLDEARAMAQDAIRCVIESALRAGEKIPQDIETIRKPIKELVTVVIA